VSDVVIRIEGVGKKYRVGKAAGAPRYQCLRDTLAHGVQGWGRRLTGRGAPPPPPAEEFWALKDVSFDVRRGEVVGIIGRNGAGKSTLLKILSRITAPTAGRLRIRGRVASLLEVGTGFHPELTGRENIFLNGAILGMGRKEIVRKFDEIVAFAEIEKFIDTPVKYYSSGMYMRLAFAVAAHLEPDILIVDEVLAVGDAAFQKKCLGKMEDVSRGGRTVLFVSHNMTAVQTLCQRTILLRIGRVAFVGDARQGIGQYLNEAESQKARERRWSDDNSAPTNGDVRLLGVRVVTTGEESELGLTNAHAFRIEFDYRVLTPALFLNLSMVLYNEDNVCIFASPSVTDSTWYRKPFPTGLYRSGCNIPGNLLNDGLYRVRLLVVKDTTTCLLDIDSILNFEIVDCGQHRGDWYGDWIGVVRPILTWQTKCI
jgi:lipopolysaccharide transport system ATP-binding protein